MILGIVFLVLGILILLQALGIFIGSVWNLFWAIVLIAIGLKLLAKRKSCFICDFGGKDWFGKMHGKFHNYQEKEQKEDKTNN